MFSTVISVALGGAIGAVLRYLVGLAVAFPMGTLAVNVVGSFAIGLVWAQFAGKSPSPAAMPFLMTGVLGGFTTFSTFSLDTLRLIHDGRIVFAGGYVVASVLLSLLACALGLYLIKGAAV
jgi:CrcB protein